MKLLATDQQAIIAQCTPRGSGAIALLRISGTNALEVATRISKLASGKTLQELPSHTIHYGFIVDDSGAHVDQVLFLLMQAPKTFTGQDSVEITCHNNQFIIEQIISLAIDKGARLADPGEFTKRAVLSNKLDLVQAEALNELIHANTQMSLKQSLAQLEGSFSHWVTKVEQHLLKALAFCQASFEFIDEEITFDDQIKQIINESLETIASVKKTFDKQQHIRQGIRIAIIGSINTGKSSLFNALLQQKRAIVTNIAGTTRDVIEAGLYKNGNYWTLIDTAGLRQTNNTIEKEGIKRSFQQAQQADIIVLVFDSSCVLTKSEQDVYQQLLNKYQNKIIAVRNKVDLEQKDPSFDLKYIDVSTQINTGIEKLEQKLQDHIENLFKEIESPFLLNQRQFNLLLGLQKKLIELQPLLTDDMQHELVSYHLEDALAKLSELTGKTISEQTMDTVFRQFCVGK